jgi:hypothetical protein
MSDGETLIVALLFVVALVVAWTALEIQRMHANLEPLINSPLARAVS